MVTELVEWFFCFFTLPKKEVPNSLVMTLPRCGTMRTSGHIFLAASAATVAFGCPTWCFLNRNCLLRLLVSMTSRSMISMSLKPERTKLCRCRRAREFRNSRLRGLGFHVWGFEGLNKLLEA